MPIPDKDTIYIDIDEEITGIIDKIRSSNAKVVALVLPKRAAVFQSIVNMKLLKRATDEAKKHVALITTEAGLLPLAGAVGIHVAKTLTSKPEIPPPPQAFDDSEETVEETADLNDAEEPEINAANSGARSVGELATAASAVPPTTGGVETLELDNDEEKPAAADEKKPKAPKAKKDKGLKVPNFNRFRLLLILGAVVLICLIVIIYAAAVALPKASITVKTDASDVNTSVPITLSTTATSIDPSTGTVPAKQVNEQKTYTSTANATGQQNNGAKATGTVTMTGQECAPNLGQPPTVPAGAGVTSNGQTYITQEDTTFSPLGSGKGNCQNYQATSATDISAQNGGTAYNTSSSSFAVPGRSDVTASGSASGGTDDIVQIVTQNDINSAENKITTPTTPKSDLKQQLEQQNLYPLVATYNAGTPAITTSVNAGATANNVTVTESITYTMYGVQRAYLQTLINNNISSQVNTAQQAILDDGLSTASFTVNNATATTLTMATTAEVGPNISSSDIAQQAAGKKSGAIQAAVGSDPHVTSVTVHLSPFWVSTAPKKLSKITVTIAKPTASSNASSQ